MKTKIFLVLFFSLLLAACGSMSSAPAPAPAAGPAGSQQVVVVYLDQYGQPIPSGAVGVAPAYSGGGIAPSAGGNNQGGGEICRYREGYTSTGKTVQSGFSLMGPAVIKPYRDYAHAIMVAPGVPYTTVQSDEVVWLLYGDAACVQAQSQYFATSAWSTTP